MAVLKGSALRKAGADFLTHWMTALTSSKPALAGSPGVLPWEKAV